MNANAKSLCQFYIISFTCLFTPVGSFLFSRKTVANASSDLRYGEIVLKEGQKLKVPAKKYAALRIAERSVAELRVRPLHGGYELVGMHAGATWLYARTLDGAPETKYRLKVIPKSTQKGKTAKLKKTSECENAGNVRDRKSCGPGALVVPGWHE